jgi:hypothetical protein
MYKRDAFTWEAVSYGKAYYMEVPEFGQQYRTGYKDADGVHLLGSKHYTLTLPPNPPVKDFWSIVVYDPQTRSMLQTDQKYPKKNNSNDNLVYNKDGSVDLFFGPKAPKRKEANWIQTVPAKAWFVLFRVYGPLQP